jgi:crotonobetainyl-CoA:carnitine CoA-transferase CaiB-like acyl-CoA transferase
VRFCDAIGRNDLRDDPRFRTNADRMQHRDELKGVLEREFESLTAERLAEKLQAHQVPYGRVRDTRQAVEHPQVEPRQMLLTQHHPTVGTVQTLGPVVKLSRTPAEPTLPPPTLGEHTDDVLKALG